MRRVKVNFEHTQQRVFYDLGSSPSLLTSLISWIEDNAACIGSFSLAFYLFNNRVLYQTLKCLASSGCQIIVYSIPLEGYDNQNPQVLTSYQTGEPVQAPPQTKYDLAKEIYDDVLASDTPNFHLRVVPHLFIRSPRVKAFSRGNMPYSLHCKSFLVEMVEGQYLAGISSSNFAVRDLPKHDFLAICELNDLEAQVSKNFFNGLEENSIPIDKKMDLSQTFAAEVKMREAPPQSQNMFIAPYYENSSAIFENNLISMIQKAKKRIRICAQHISAFEYSYQTNFSSEKTDSPNIIKREGFLSHALKKAREGVAVSFLSQTFVASDQKAGFRTPRNMGMFQNFVSAASKVANCHYYVNEIVHSKFIVVDDYVVLTTSNFTPTQFIYIKDVNIERFDNIPNTSYSGIHCEYGQYIAFHNETIADKMDNEFEFIKNLESTFAAF